MQTANPPVAAESMVTRGRDRETISEPDLEARTSYHEIFKSSAIIGGSSIVNMLIGLVRTKAMAVMLGPAGLGLMGAFTSITDLARTFAELGINSSGVRQIAESVGTGDTNKIARTVTVLRRMALVLGVLGGLLLAVFAAPIGYLTFGNDTQTWAVTLLALVVLFRLVADGQGALLQGMRRIGDIARVNILGVIFGSALAIALVFWWRERGVALALVGVSATSLATSWWYSRRVRVAQPALRLAEVAHEVKALVWLVWHSCRAQY